ncbi:MAG: anti-sigma factor family protein [Candidatus Acidiferrales bacterium]
MISALHDGEAVSAEAVRHIADCKDCRERLGNYAAIAAEIRLLAAHERKELTVQTIVKEVMPKRSSLTLALRKKMRVPRFAAAACALVIILLAGGWAHTRAQNTPLWFQYRFSFNIEGARASAGSVTQACGPRCEHAITLSESKRIAGLVDVQKIEDGKVYLSLRLKRFDTLPDFKHLAEQMTNVSAATYVYQPGNVVRIPVSGGGEVEMEGVIVASQEGVPGWYGFPSQPGENQIVVQQGVLIRDGRVIAEMPGSGSATAASSDSDAGFYAYAPGQGLFAVGLKPFHGAIVGSVDYGQIRFTENGAKYLLLSGSQLTGGAQPRNIWVLHLPEYLPSQHDPQTNDGYVQFGTSSNLTRMLQEMGAIQQ